MIQYKLLKSKLTGDVYAQQVESHPFTSNDRREKLKKQYGSIAIAVLDDTFSIITEELGEGKTVSLDEFGTFSIRLGITKKAVKDFKEVNTHDIKIKGIRFKPSKVLKRELYSQEIHLQKGDTKRRKNTTDDRWVALYNYILEQMNTYGKPREDIVITTTLYRQLTNCTDYAARKELAQFCQEGSLHRIPTAKTLLYTLAI